MKLNYLLALSAVTLTGCNSLAVPGDAPATLTEARKGFKTTLTPGKSRKGPVDKPPPAVFTLLKYPSAVGELSAYLTPDPGDGKKHPAIIWITGGDCNSIGEVWETSSPGNDQTAAAYRKAGIVMMFPSLRGGNDNPGEKEGFLGEVDDVLAAAKYLETQPYVDPKRLYLGGHSTGGTLAMLVAEASPRFRAAFAFGAVANVAGYGEDSGFLPIDIKNKEEVKLRSPGYWLSSVQSPLWVLEGTGGNIEDLRVMAKISTNARIRFIEVKGVDHFATLAPTNELIAKKIMADTSDPSRLSLSSAEVNKLFAK